MLFPILMRLLQHCYSARYAGKEEKVNKQREAEQANPFNLVYEILFEHAHTFLVSTRLSKPEGLIMHTSKSSATIILQIEEN